jgi:iron complex outermembrane receptor protein
MNASGAANAPDLRGVGTSVTDVGSDPNVATYIDGFYQGSQATLAFDLPDIDQTQVLKGPQGTLFGCNATGGDILVTTLQPSLTPTGSLTLGYGNSHSATVKGYYSGPVVDDKLAGGILLYWDERGGYRQCPSICLHCRRSGDRAMKRSEV